MACYLQKLAERGVIQVDESYNHLVIVDFLDANPPANPNIVVSALRSLARLSANHPGHPELARRLRALAVRKNVAKEFVDECVEGELAAARRAETVRTAAPFSQTLIQEQKTSKRAQARTCAYEAADDSDAAWRARNRPPPGGWPRPNRYAWQRFDGATGRCTTDPVSPAACRHPNDTSRAQDRSARKRRRRGRYGWQTWSLAFDQDPETRSRRRERGDPPEPELGFDESASPASSPDRGTDDVVLSAGTDLAGRKGRIRKLVRKMSRQNKGYKNNACDNLQPLPIQPASKMRYSREEIEMRERKRLDDQLLSLGRCIEERRGGEKPSAVMLAPPQAHKAELGQARLMEAPCRREER